MKTRLIQPVLPILAFSLLATPAIAQATGVSHPDQTTGDASAPSSAQTSDHYVMPSHADSAPASAASAQGYPATSAGEDTSFAATGPVPAAASAPAQAPPALIVRQTLPATAPTGGPPAYGSVPVQTASYAAGPGADAASDAGTDDGMVQVRLVPHQLNEGVVLKTRLDQVLSTESTVKGTAFSAQLLTDAGHSGEVLLPAGSVLHGTVASIHGGKRISGQAEIRLQAESVTLPDGTTYPLHAIVSGVESNEDQHVNSEGAIQPTTHPKETAIALGSVTGAATIMGAAIGGGVGAVVGAGVGVGAGAIWWLKRDHQTSLPAGTTIFFSLDEPFQASR